jgi:outer membrane protein TolC
LDIEVKYWDLVLAQRQLEVAGSALDLSIEQLQRDRRRREAGVSTDVEVIQDEATVARRIEGVLLVETALETCMDRLRSTIFPGVEQGAWSVQIRPITAMPEIAPAPAGAEWDDEIRSALTLRSEVKLAEFDVKIATALHARTASEKQSSLDLLFQVGSQGFDEGVGRSLGEALSYDSPTVAAGLSYQLPMKNTALANEERAARAEMRGARLGLDAAKSQIANEVREALRQVRYQSEASLAANKTREAAERLVTAEMTRYEQGLATTFQVLEFQQALVEAQYSERAGLTAYCQALARLEAARGQIGGNGRRSPGEIAP